MEQSRVQQNYWAIVVSAIACFMFQALWYWVFLKPWLAGIGHSMEWMMGPAAYSPVLQYGTAFVSAGLIAAAISCVTQLTGPQTALRGVRAGVLLWLGFVLTTYSTEYVFEAKPWSLLGINAGFYLFGMILMGAIVGGWKKTKASSVAVETRAALNAQ
jgi:hypothetical protein